MSSTKPAIWVATLGGIGYAPKAPGTFGTIGALPIAAVIQYFGGPIALCAATAALYVVGLWACRLVTADGPEKDPGHIVVDEAVGVWIALIPAGLDWKLYVVGFLVFRLFDIAKPWPVSWADKRVPGAHGVMLDDVIAGLFALPLVAGVRFWLG